MKLEAVRSRQVPPKLVLLPHHQRKLPAEGVFALPGYVAKNPCGARRRVDQTRQHLERCCLARPIRSQEPNNLARLDVEADVLDRADFLVLSPKQATQGAEQALFLLINAVGLRQAAGLDDRHDGFSALRLALAGASER